MIHMLMQYSTTKQFFSGVHCCQLQAAAAACISNKCYWATSVRGGGGDLNGWCMVADQKCPFFVFANFVKYEKFAFGENCL